MENGLFLIIVYFNPNAVQIARTEKLGSIYNTIVVDNSCDTLIGDHSFMYIPLNSNRGIGYAQNIGIKCAIEKGANYILFFDQDSDFDSLYPQQLLKSYLSLVSNGHNIAFLGPLFIDSRTNVPFLKYGKERYEQARELISSGLITSTDVISKIGYLDDSLFIDYVDFEWCWRARSLGFRSFIDTELKIFHSVGYDFRQVFGLKCYLSSPIRYYYQYRNCLLLLGKSYVPLLWKIKCLMRKLVDLFLIPFLVKEPSKTIKYMVEGIIDGINAKKGIYG